MQYNLNEQIQKCEKIKKNEKMEARNDTGKVSINALILFFNYLETKIWFSYLWTKKANTSPKIN